MKKGHGKKITEEAIEGLDVEELGPDESFADEGSEDRGGGKRRKLGKGQLRLLLKIGIVFLLMMAILSTYEIIQLSNQYRDSIRKYDELESMVKVEETEGAVTSTRSLIADEDSDGTEEAAPAEPSKIKVDIDVDFPSLKTINPDVMGWIYYAPLEISYPVVVDRGDDFYEHYGFDLEKNVAGAIFLDYACRQDMQSFNTIIYGHNMRNGTMFGSLKKLLNDPSIIEEDPYFYVITENKIYMYEIFADYTCRSGAKTYDLKLTYTEDEMKEYLDYIAGTANYKRDDFFAKGISEDMKICTLSTCHGVNSGNRTVIHGELVEEADR